MHWLYDILNGTQGETLEQFATRMGREVERLVRAEERFNLAVRLAGVAVFRVSRDLRYEWVFNPQFDDRVVGEDLVGKGNRDIFVADDAALLDSLFAEAFTSGLPQTFDMRLRCLRDGQERHLEMLVEPLRGDDGAVEALTGAALNLSPEVERQHEIRTARQEAQLARREAERANRTKTRFMAAAGHDLRQPLQAMRFFQDMVANRFRVSGDQTGLKAAEAIGQAISSAEELLASLMDLATLESGEVELHVVDFPANDVVDGNVSEFRGMAERKGLGLRVRPCAQMIRSDPVLLKRIIRNLTINAIKYTDQGGVLVGCRRRGNCLRIDVRDTGRGIPQEQLALVFDEFYRGDEAGDPGGWPRHRVGHRGTHGTPARPRCDTAFAPGQGIAVRHHGTFGIVVKFGRWMLEGAISFGTGYGRNIPPRKAVRVCILPASAQSIGKRHHTHDAEITRERWPAAAATCPFSFGKDQAHACPHHAGNPSLSADRR